MGRYAQSEDVDMPGQARDAINGGAAQVGRWWKRWTKLRCIDDEDSRDAPDEGPRSQARFVPRCGELGNLPRPYPNNIVNWVTTRNYGFSDAADLFIFISGYTVAFVFARMMLERGFIIGATRLVKRVWQIYVAHVFLFVLYLAEIGYVAQRSGNSGFTDDFNIRGFLDNPAQFLFEGLILRFKPVNMDVLPLYIVLMGIFPPILWLMLRRPNMTLATSGVLYVAARHFGWNLSAYPTGLWYFNPFAWQFLFTFGAWFALGGAAQAMPFVRSRTALVLGIGYLLFALVMTMAARFDELRALIPPEIYSAFNPNDKTNSRLIACCTSSCSRSSSFVCCHAIGRDWNGRSFGPQSNAVSSRSKSSAPGYSCLLLHTSCWSRFRARSGCRLWSALSAS